MELKEIEIVSYRSIVNHKIQINEKCMAFIGLNESGKTNILYAIRLLENGFSVSLKDKSKINNELPKVRYVFILNDSQKSEVYDIVNNELSKVLILPYENIIKHFSFNNYVTTRYLAKEKEEYKKFKTYSCNYEIEIIGGFLKLKDGITIDPEVEITYKDLNYKLATLPLVLKDVVPDQYHNNYESVDIEYFRKFISTAIHNHLDKNVPTVIFWEYNNKYLLPSEITYEAFIKGDQPYENSAPLFNIFMISRRLNIDDSDELLIKINEWKIDSSLRRKDSHIITEDLNKYIRSIWQDYDQNIKVELEETKITIHINDPDSNIGNFYEMESRSQGFKTFISFILTIAAEIEADMLSNCILLLDEPETHLHPSGVRFMREELFKLSKSNYIFFATHSIFMIDRSNLKRHLIIKKDREITKIIPVVRNNIIQESVIYEALGTTVDEFSIRNKNIIFEGEMDLILFQYFMEKCVPQKINTLLDYELHDAGGTKNINSFFKDKVIPKESEWIIILDNDGPGASLKSEIEKHSPNKNIEFNYYSNTDGIELEDLLPNENIEKAIQVCEAKIGIQITFPIKLDGSKPINGIIEEYKNRNRINDKSVFNEIFKSELINIIKTDLDSIKDTTIGKRRESFSNKYPKYFLFIKELLQRKQIALDGEKE